jgi:hypothetical protein
MVRDASGHCRGNYQRLVQIQTETLPNLVILVVNRAEITDSHDYDVVARILE